MTHLYVAASYLTLSRNYNYSYCIDNENLIGIGTATKTLSVNPLMSTSKTLKAHTEDILCTGRKLHIEKASFMFTHTVAEIPNQS